MPPRGHLTLPPTLLPALHHANRVQNPSGLLSPSRAQRGDHKPCLSLPPRSPRAHVDVSWCLYVIGRFPRVAHTGRLSCRGASSVDLSLVFSTRARAATASVLVRGHGSCGRSCGRDGRQHMVPTSRDLLVPTVSLHTLLAVVSSSSHLLSPRALRPPPRC